MLKIYGANLSGPANKVRMLANYLNLDYDYTIVNIREGDHKKEEYLQINPIGKVPAIDDDGFCLFESGTICRYLCDKHNSDLYPRDTKERANVDKWMDFVALHVNTAMARLAFNRLFVPMMGIDVDEQSVKDGISFLGRYLPIIDEQLSKNKYLAGDKFTLADITLITALDPAEAVEYDLSPYSNITKWRDQLMKEEFYTKCHENYQSVLAQLAAK